MEAAPAMDAGIVHLLIGAATLTSGLLAGARLGQSIKQLPARRKIGVVTFSRYSEAADLGNGVLWYAILGIGAALLTIAAPVAAWVGEARLRHGELLWAAATLAVLHSFTTAKAAPINVSQRSAGDDPDKLAMIFDRFERWQTIRCVLQTLTFIALLTAL